MTMIESVILALGGLVVFVILFILYIIFEAPEEHLSPDALFLRKRFRKTKDKRRKSK